MLILTLSQVFTGFTQAALGVAAGANRVFNVERRLATEVSLSWKIHVISGPPSP
jgi:hypothetical protein